MKFFSLKYSELILTVDPKTFTVEGGFRVTKGMMGLYPQGLSINFKNREFDTSSLNLEDRDEKRLIKILKRHPSYGLSFIAEDHNEDEEVQESQTAKQAKADKEVAKTVAADTNHDKPKNKSN